jgi:hypothetical protein
MNPFDELIKCKDDFKYFVHTFVKISHPVRGLIPLNLFPFQERLIQEYENHRFNILVKFRQGGFTTITVLYMLWRCMFKTDQNIFIASKTDREAVHVGKIVDTTINHFPEWLKPNMSTNTKNEKVFSFTNSRLTFRTIEAARSRSLTHLVIDEAAFIPNLEEKWKFVYPCFATGGSCIVLSTTNGVGNWFEETYHRAADKTNNFHIIDITYKDHPDYSNEEWVNKMRKCLGEKGFHQEVLGYFVCDNWHKDQKVMEKSLEATMCLTNEELAFRLKTGKLWMLDDQEHFEDYFLIQEAAQRLVK